MGKTEVVEQGFQNALGGFNELQNKYLVEALAGYSKRIQDAITTDAGNITKQTLDVQQGFVAEAHHAGSYNIEAATKGANNHRATTDIGQRNDPVTDIRINTPDGSKDYQAKFYKDGESSAKAFDHGRYQDVNKLVPEDQLDTARATANRQAQRNSRTRPDVSKNYEKTANTLDDSIHSDDRSDIRSTPLKRRGKGSSEELVEKAKHNGSGPEYADKDRVRAEFNNMQYANAAKAGALTGASMMAVSELVGILRSDKPLTQEQCMLAAERVVLGSLKGAGNAVLVTGIQHVGQSLVDTANSTALKATGRHLIKGNIAAAAANIVVNLSQNIYQFSRGEIDSLEFAGSTISNSVSVVGGAMAYSGGTATATFLGQWVASEVATKALLGTTLGALGPIALGAVFSIGFSFALSAYVGYFAGEGRQLAMSDIQCAMAQLNNGSISLSQYTGIVGTMSDFKFQWKDVLPFSGSISVFSEYRERKSQLMVVQKDLAARIASLPEHEASILYQLNASYQQQVQHIEQEYQCMRSQITGQAAERYEALSDDLNAHLELKYLMFTPVKKIFEAEHVALTAAERKQQTQQAHIEAYRQELERLLLSIEHTDLIDTDVQRIKYTLLATINTRLSEILPAKTSWDEAYEFLALQ